MTIFCPMLGIVNEFLQQIQVKNVHAVSGAGIRTHDLLNMSQLP